MELFLYLFLIFLGGAIPLMEYMVVIPFGIIAGLPTIPVVIAAFLGNLLGVVLIILFVDKVKTLLRNRKERKQYIFKKNAAGEEQQDESPEEDQQTNKSLSETRGERKRKREERAKQLWEKYGVAGLAFFGTLLLSSYISAIMACTFGGNRAYVTLWMAISLAVWSIATGIVFHFGMGIFFR